MEESKSKKWRKKKSLGHQFVSANKNCVYPRHSNHSHVQLPLQVSGSMWVSWIFITKFSNLTNLSSSFKNALKLYKETFFSCLWTASLVTQTIPQGLGPAKFTYGWLLHFLWLLNHDLCWWNSSSKSLSLVGIIQGWESGLRS